MRWQQLLALDHFLFLVVVEPILARLEARDDRMPGLFRMLGCMLARRTVAAADVATFRTAAEVKPPALRRCHAFHTPSATWFRRGVDSGQSLFHFRFSFRVRFSQNGAQPPAARARFW
jgi:hypothetical protein